MVSKLKAAYKTAAPKIKAQYGAMKPKLETAYATVKPKVTTAIKKTVATARMKKPKFPK